MSRRVFLSRLLWLSACCGRRYFRVWICAQKGRRTSEVGRHRQNFNASMLMIDVELRLPNCGKEDGVDPAAACSERKPTPLQRIRRSCVISRTGTSLGPVRSDSPEQNGGFATGRG